MSRDANGRWTPGKSANPAGARKLTPADRRARDHRRKAESARAEAQQNVQKKFQAKIDAVSEATLRSALEGDAASQRLVLERVDPPRRPESPPMTIPGFDKDVETASNAVMSLVADGRISVEKGEALLAMLEKRAQLAFAQSVVFEMHRLQQNLKQRGIEALVPALMEAAA